MGRIGQAWSTTQDAIKTCAADTRWYYYGSSFLVAVITLTHYVHGYKTTMIGLSYADTICITSIAVALCITALGTHGVFKRLRRPIIAVAAFFPSFSFLLMRAATAFAPHIYGVAFIVSAVSVGVFIGIIAVYWFDFFVGQAVETVAFSLLGSIILGCVISWFLLGMLWDRVLVGYIAVVLCAGWTISHALDTRPKRIPRTESTERPSFTFLAGPLLTAFLFSFAFMLSVSFVGLESWHSDAGWSMLWPAAIVLGIVALFSKKVNVASLLYLALTLVVAGMLFASFLHIDESFIFSLATMGCAVNISYLVILFCNIGGRFSINSYRLASLLLISVFSGCLLGRPAALAMDALDASGTLKTLVSICLVIAIIACTLFSLSNRTIQLYSKYRFKEQGKTGDASVETSSFIAAFAIEQGLGAREQEALALLLEGKTASEVAECMFIARGTAKAHIRHIYRKLDVHDREELFGLMRDVDPQFEVERSA
ncbi:response regulator transcription factor [Raoultibacter phocaeensis]|uniref:response regulator transcription factor n=1 Tax=Raoultibacter phocaeensis TaxID=2479841 RepID=UPI0015D57A3A|nr:helix-turn-helix transcriptional regulator [Raoultibacter phocaeensis]